MLERDELQRKYEAAKKKLEQTEHRLHKLENEMKYLERKRSDEDRRRTHIVAHKGGVIEDLFPVSDPEKCKKCQMCLKPGCPAITKRADGTIAIDDTLCNGCDLCKSLCKFDAINNVVI